MPVRTKDGLSHLIKRHEDNVSYGKTLCDVIYTIEPAAVHVFPGLEVAKLSKMPATCLVCISNEHPP